MTTTTTTTTTGERTTEVGPNSLRTLIYDDTGDKPSLQVLDQLLIPDEKRYINIPDVRAAWTVIRNMNIRGAPLIAIVACLGLAVDLKSDKVSQELDEIVEMNGEKNHFDAVYSYIEGKMNYLFTSRPTAVNLQNALEEMKAKILHLQNNKDTSDDCDGMSDRHRIVTTIVQYARFMLNRDREDNMTLARYGADAILSTKKPGQKVTIITICNTGSLATSHYGTALGVVRAIRERNQLQKIVALETRPYNQGSRLTAFEIVEEQMPNGTLICDSMAASLMDKERVDAVVIGADRICANGDTANKVGSYSLALAAAAHQVPFYVAAPCTTLDINMPRGSDIHIEERPAEEILLSSRAPKNILVWNPSFDVTPAKFITGIITEKGVIYPAPNGTIDVAAFVKAQVQGSDAVSEQKRFGPGVKLHVPIDYFEQSTKTLPDYLATNAHEVMKVLAAEAAQDLECVELGGGDVNLIFRVSNKDKQVIVKQALPYLRVAGESWPLAVDRAFFEYKALTSAREQCPDLVPEVYFFSRPSMLLVMECLPSPNIVLRSGLNKGIRYPTMAADMGRYCAKNLFSTSGFALSSKALRENVELWSQNRDMCNLTEQLVFTEPYLDCANNRWTSPQLDDEKKAIETDLELNFAAVKAKNRFISTSEALIHANLSTGSVMCSPAEGQTHVIGQEYACYGPMAFDTGVFIADLLLSYVSQPGHVHSSGAEAYGNWILEQIQIFWDTFISAFMEQWNDPTKHTGFTYDRKTISDGGMECCQEEWQTDILRDTLSFAGMEMIRRIVGIAHVMDLDAIGDPDVRADCERHGLSVAKKLMKSRNMFRSMSEAIEIAKVLKQV